MLRRTSLCCLFAVLAGACATEATDDAAVAREASVPLTGRAIEFALEPDALDKSAIDAIGKHIEATMGAESISIQIKQSDDEGATVVIEAWGRTPISDDAVVAGLRKQFPALANAMIGVSRLEGDGPSGRLPEIEVDADEDADVVRQRVIEQLRADGVQGDVQVHVEDGEDRREVRVEIEDRKHQ